MKERAKRLLVVDDEPRTLAILRDHFEDTGYEVLTAEDGDQGLATFEQQATTIDLVITDIRMPGLSGGELIQKLRQRRPFLPIIGITGHADLKGKLALLGEGAYYYLDKPLPDWPIVDRLVDNAIRLHRHEATVYDLRAKELSIGRLMRAYLIDRPIHGEESHGRVQGSGIDLRIAMDSANVERPGGDYVEWFRRGEEEVLFYLADAAGHDDLHACFMACLASMVLHRSHHGRRPGAGEIIQAIDHALSQLRQAEVLEAGKYLTFFLGLIDLGSGTLTYVNAGHPAAFLQGQEPRQLASNSRPVGFLFGQDPDSGELQLSPGDLLFVYSDGASEMLEEGDGHQAGVDRLAELLRPLEASPPAAIVTDTLELLRKKTADGQFEDDTTLLAIRIEDGSQQARS